MHLEEILLVPPLHPSVLASSRDDASQAEVDPPHRDPFESLVLEGFSLQSVGSTLGPHPSATAPSQREELLWLTLHMGATDGTHPRKVQMDKTEKLYWQREGSFAPPSWPAALPVFNRVLEEDKALRDLQAQ